MTIYKGNSPDNDLGDDFSNAPVRETPLYRGMAAAKATERARVLAVLSGAQADVSRTALKKSLNQQSRDAYDRAYDRLERAAQIHANETGADVSIPVRDPPAALPPELRAWARELVATLAKHKIAASALPEPSLIQVISPRTTDSQYRETLGLGKSGTGAPPPNFADPDANKGWLNVQGVAS